MFIKEVNYTDNGKKKRGIMFETKGNAQDVLITEEGNVERLVDKKGRLNSKFEDFSPTNELTIKINEIK